MTSHRNFRNSRRVAAVQVLWLALAFVSARDVCLALGDGGQQSRAEQDAGQPTAEQIEFFEKQVRPLLAENCWECHGTEAQEGRLRLDSRAAALRGGDTGPAVVPGEPDRSEMILAIGYDPDGYQMPPTGKLPQEAIATLTNWVRMGAPWPEDARAADSSAGHEFDIASRAEHWSFQPVQRPSVPQAARADWAASPLDRFILARLEQSGLSPAAPAERRTWLRRVSYDLIGLPPSPADTADFLADGSPDAEHKLVDRLLASPHYGERWGRHWLDLVRYAETAGHEFDYDIPYAWRYRDYVVRAFNADLPYDQFVIEHVAGDLLEARRHVTEGWNESILATGFWWFNQGKHSPVDVRAEECDRFDNKIDVLGKAFLGVTIACARCHDHKFDPISTADYYALAGYLQSTRRQIAFVDGEQIHETRIRLEDMKRENRLLIVEAVGEIAIAAAGSGLHEPGGATADLSGLAHAWRVLREHQNPESFAGARRTLLERAEQQLLEAAGPDGVEVFEEFDPTVAFELQDAGVGGDPGGDGGDRERRWYTTGAAFGTGPTIAGDFVLDNAAPKADAERVSPDAAHANSQPLPIREVLPGGLAHSGRLSPRFLGTLRSETFTITRPYIDYRVQRVGGRSSPGAKHKNGQIHFIVDGFHLIQEPLYGGLSVNTANDGEFHWYRQDVSKLVGSRGYIEIEDEEPDGWIVVDRILFSDGPRPADPPNREVLELLSDPSIDSRQGFARAYAARVAEAASAWRTEKIAGTPRANDQIALLNGAFEQAARIGADGPSRASEPSLTQFLTSYARAEHSLAPSRRAIAALDGSAENEPVLIRGNHKKPGPEVPRRFLEAFEEPHLAAIVSRPDAPPEHGSGRIDLAQAMADPDNPLTSRVLVNRLWHYHFGRGLVPTVDNFGVLGELPSHPELLDWLAAEFVEGGFRLKRMQRAMVLSATYRQRSVPEERAAAQDPENRLWHSMPVRRLEAEAIRDGMLAVSGRLDRRLEGESVPPHLTPFMEGRGRPSASGPVDGDGRRSVYIAVRRNFLTPLFLAFDYPNPLSTMGRRSVSNVPAQALALMNNPFVLQQAEQWAERTLAEAGPDAEPESVVRQLYETAFTRPPTAAEVEAALAFLEPGEGEALATVSRDRWAEFCHVLLNVKEFVFLP